MHSFPPAACVGLIGAGANKFPIPAYVTPLSDAFRDADPYKRRILAIEMNQRKAAGASFAIASNDLVLLRELSDEIWWLDENMQVRMRGEPGEVVSAFQRDVAERLRAWGENQRAPMLPVMRKGDDRGEIVALETLGASGMPAMVWRSGEDVKIRVSVLYRERVGNPVIGIMIRTRIGFAVYGTNTELESVLIGPRQAGERIAVEFAFRCELCPGEYTLTAASHDPDGTAHDWIDDAVAFIVTDSRPTAGVANLRAKVSVTSLRE